MSIPNHKRPVEDFQKQIDLIRAAGFNPIGVTQMNLEDTFIFTSAEEAEEAYRTLERDYDEKWIGTVDGWWYGKEDFLLAQIEYEEEHREDEVIMLIHWLEEGHN